MNMKEGMLFLLVYRRLVNTQSCNLEVLVDRIIAAYDRNSNVVSMYILHIVKVIKRKPLRSLGKTITLTIVIATIYKRTPN